MKKTKRLSILTFCLFAALSLCIAAGNLALADIGTAPVIQFLGNGVLTADAGADKEGFESYLKNTDSEKPVLIGVTENVAVSDVEVSYSKGALTNENKLVSGKHTVTLTATDADGEKSEPLEVPLYVLGESPNMVTDGAAGTDKGFLVGQIEDQPNTMEAWIKLPKDAPAASAGRWGAIFANYIGNNMIKGCFSMEIHNNGRLDMIWGSTSHLYSSAVDLRNDVWTHVAVVRDKENAKVWFYVNGESIGNADFGSNTVADDLDLTVDAPFYVGRDSRASAARFRGSIAGASIFSTARTPAQIKSDMEQLFTGGEFDSPADVLYSCDLTKKINVSTSSDSIETDVTKTADEADAQVKALFTSVTDRIGRQVNSFDITYSNDIYNEIAFNEGQGTATVTITDKFGDTFVYTVNVIVLPVENQVPVILYTGENPLIRQAGTAKDDFEAFLNGKINVIDDNTAAAVSISYTVNPFGSSEKLKAGRYVVRLNVSDEDGNAAEEKTFELFVIEGGVDFSSDLDKPSGTNGVNLKAFPAGEINLAPNTMEAWIKLPADGGGNGNGAARYGVIFGNFVSGSSANTARSSLLEIFSGNIDLYWHGTHYRCSEAASNIMPGKSTEPSDYIVRTGEWVHIAVVRNVAAGTIDFYKNGVMIGQMNIVGNAAAEISNPLPYYIGNDGRSQTAEHKNAVFMGEISSVTVWSGARTAEQIKAGMLASFSADEEGLIKQIVLSQRVGATSVTYSGGNIEKTRFTTVAAFEAEMIASGTVTATDPVGRPIEYTFEYSQGAVTDNAFRTVGEFTVTVRAVSPAYNDADSVTVALKIVASEAIKPQIVYSGGAAEIYDYGESVTKDKLTKDIAANITVVDDTASSDDVVFVFSEGMFDTTGKLKEGVHSVTLTLTDADGISADEVVIRVYVIKDYVDFATDTTGTPKTSYSFSTGKALAGNPNTMEAWVNIPEDVPLNTGSPNRIGSIIGSWTNGATQVDSYALEFHSDGTVILYWGSYVRLMAPQSVPKVKTGEWTHVAVTRDTEVKQVKFYINGELCAAVDIGGTALMTDVATGDLGLVMWIGKDGRAEDGKYTGKAASVAVFGSARSETQIKSDMKDMLEKASWAESDLLYFVNLGKMTTDGTGPVITVKYGEKVCLDGETVTLTEGDSKPVFTVSARDEISGECICGTSYSEGAVNIYGEMIKGSHKVVFTASDKSGNTTTFTLNLKVEPKKSGNNGGGNKGGGGCGSAANTALPLVVTLAGALLITRKRVI